MIHRFQKKGLTIIDQTLPYKPNRVYIDSKLTDTFLTKAYPTTPGSQDHLHPFSQQQRSHLMSLPISLSLDR